MDMGSVAEPTGDGERPLHCRLLQLNKMEHYDRLMKNGKMLEDENKLVAFKLKKLQYNSQIDLRIRKMKSDLKKIIGFQFNLLCLNADIKSMRRNVEQEEAYVELQCC
ncbi:uncharacterized protein LOC124702194 isoform X1 [Lolium rigidum]|uniref:uncharacterized protein LOC124702194 isoform X1 n=1 Tax=Lolium rigidum TaxID=89674 RepID=UPI001F5D9020|nr:uncharacterized protein LOC124702194 isoform X1 [Lolium rigidum]XP_047090266.1 uncharacterized protein LOC124702194 isoform X1 [Lolium rigidum]XP_047090267.1 uncharacterized protein LOC124702194 isoform X1 [Lolium rigidum]XP_047090268.1 uncharacterized protein LOC124702194 isoform X1 [Lolium rigidum]XP_047090269.1 uncharacterized protein LOC124702194 isoform X1 [Lolium rigidum]XP_047090271.1 uncharacterized protein LOC124702194 isoform X1 [Lolium rigidum]